MRFFTFLLSFLSLTTLATPSTPRARDLGLTFGTGTPGPWNAITDVKGVRVGQVTLNVGSGKLVPGKGPVRTGVTVILPTSDNIWKQKVSAGAFILNGNGEAMGLMWIQESGILETPIAFTNTLSVSDAQKGLLQWMTTQNPDIGIKDDTLTPVVLECDDSTLNDIRGYHVKPSHVLEAIEKAGTQVQEGSVGAGTGMISYEFKAGIGTASRVLPKDKGGYTIGVLLNANHGRRRDFRIPSLLLSQWLELKKPVREQEGSIVMAVATDAPLDGRQLQRLSRRALLGIARSGAIARHGSGDVAIAFSTANRIPHYPKKLTYKVEVLSDFHMDPLFEAAADIGEEALMNALVAAKEMVGRDDEKVPALPHEWISKSLSKKAN